MHIIYMATSKTSGKNYIGQTKQKLSGRKRGHKCDALTRKREDAFPSAIRKYGFDDFEWVILGEGKDQLEADTLERYFIKVYNTFKGPGYNMTEGGGLPPNRKGFKQSPEHIAKRVAHNKGNAYALGRKQSPEHIAKKVASRRKNNKGWYKDRDKTIDKMSDSASKRK